MKLVVETRMGRAEWPLLGSEKPRAASTALELLQPELWLEVGGRRVTMRDALLLVLVGVVVWQVMR